MLIRLTLIMKEGYAKGEMLKVFDEYSQCLCSPAVFASVQA